MMKPNERLTRQWKTVLQEIVIKYIA